MKILLVILVPLVLEMFAAAIFVPVRHQRHVFGPRTKKQEWVYPPPLAIPPWQDIVQNKSLLRRPRTVLHLNKKSSG